MSPKIILDKKGKVIDSFFVSSRLLDHIKDREVSFVPIDQMNGHRGVSSNNGKFEFLGSELKYNIEYSNNLYTITFNKESVLMQGKPNDLEKYKLIVEAANEIIYEADAKGIFTYVNPRTLGVTGYSEEEILGKPYLELIHPDYRDEAYKFYSSQVAKSEKSTFQEIPIITKSGEQIWIGLNVQLLENDLAIIGFLGVGRDITESYNTRLALEHSEEKYRGIIQNLRYGLMEVDLDERIVFANEAMSQITGYSFNELVGQVASDVLTDSQGKEIVNKEHKTRENGTPSVYEIPIKHKNGSYRWAMISGAPVYNVDGSIKGSIGIHMDITDRIMAEDELKRTKQSLHKYKNGLESLNALTSNVQLSFDDQVEEGLRIAKKYLGLDLAIISKVEKEEYQVEHFDSKLETELKVGDSFNLGDTFCEIVTKEKDILFMKDVSNSDLTDHPCHHLFGIEAYLGVNYMVNGEKRGTVNFSSSHPRSEEFNAFDLEFINLFSKWIGYIISMKENQTKLQSDKSYLSAINEFVTNLLDDESITDISWEIAENVIDKFGYEDCVIYIMNYESGVLEQMAAYGPKKDKERKIIEPITIQPKQGIVGSVAATGKAEIINDTSKDPRYVVDDAVRLSEITVPIIADGRVIGVIDSEHSKKDFFESEHLETLTTIANLASNRLKNAIAKKKQENAEQELKESEQKLRDILQNAIDAVITINDRGVITEWNTQAEVIFGFTSKEVIGKTLPATIIPPQHHKSHNNGMSHYMRTGDGPVLNQKIEITALRKSGEEFPIEMAIIPIESKGKHSFTAFLSDITIKRQVQSEMEKALNKERELNELKSRFVSMTSHEFRTPLTTIRQNTDLIRYGLEMDLGEKQAKYDKFLDRIDGDLNRVTSLMNDILMLGRIEAGKVSVKKNSTDFITFIQKLAKKHSESDKEGRTIKVKVSGVPQPVKIDSQLMDHVVSNLLSNALKYSPKGPSPEVELSFNYIDKVVFKVEDHGIGIPKKDIKGLFESFFRATNVSNIQGSGLGLSIVKEFVELHDGTIEVQSEEGKGSTFIIQLPFS